MVNLKEIRSYAQEIIKECEKKGYTVKEAELLTSIMMDEIRQRKEAIGDISLKALAAD